jgi:hypothetical protein
MLPLSRTNRHTYPKTDLTFDTKTDHIGQVYPRLSHVYNVALAVSGRKNHDMMSLLAPDDNQPVCSGQSLHNNMHETAGLQ